ncbi:uncharacterized protein EV422DRAFT_618547 [Fimicolochytrium jonesii]|uniref:uncharacterized protein n=1 Tax=Fimicolochytrium jonesii TaxID=1396493 RepID=UPI0022FEBD09|nr:uncharacterized protein EV422DRAFT_618547 [Fimicolochytrium jonesii]KAI8823744.1 hypothetical protein EV422DRAFT_618547 [Fimicolochytrium jonesii]
MPPRSRAKTFQLGDCLGKGAFGSVYAGLNMVSGEVVAIKQIKTVDISRSDLTLIMAEIDLLKELHHPNIVEYIGFSQTSSCLNIIMEFCENGSLSSIVKKFGRFPERLVAFYTAQVLDGLVYLHEQGVIHRDIKGANILTTKDGLVKLADFGIASKVNATSNAVAGSPYWMAPEVIELAGATTASDVWSVGATVIELMDGHPPYSKLAPMSALFRVVHDEYPPLPENCSQLLRHFLLECFQKDPNLRISAVRLLKHPLIVGARAGKRGQSGGDPRKAGERKAGTGDEERCGIAERTATSRPVDHRRSSGSENGDRASRHQRVASGTLRQDAQTLLSLAEVEDSDDAEWESDFKNISSTVFSEKLRTMSSTKSKSTTNTTMLSDLTFVESNEDEDYAGAFDLTGQEVDKTFVTPGGDLSLIPPNERVQDAIDFLDIEDDPDPFTFATDLAAFTGDIPEHDDHTHAHTLVAQRFIASLRPSTEPSIVASACRDFAAIVQSHPTSSKLFLTQHGIPPFITFLRSLPHTSTPLAADLLILFNTCNAHHPEFSETLCQLGGLSVVMRCIHPSFGKGDPRTRVQAARLLEGVCVGNPKLAVACGALPTILRMLAGDYEGCREVVWCAVEGLGGICGQTGISRTSLSLLLVSHSLIPNLTNLLVLTTLDRDPKAALYMRKILNVFLTLSLADAQIKDALAEESCLRVLVNTLGRTDPESTVTLLKCLKNISMSAETLDSFDRAGMIPVLCELLGHREIPFFVDTQNQLVNILYNFCRLSKPRQLVAVRAGVIPHLQTFIKSKSPLRQFALPLLCDIVNVGGKECWEVMRRCGVLESYLELLRDPAWRVSAVEAISIWVSEQPTTLHLPLSHPHPSHELALAFASSSSTTGFENLLTPFQRILIASASVAHNLAKSDLFMNKLVERVARHPNAGVRLNLLHVVLRIGGCFREKDLDEGMVKRREQIRRLADKLAREDPAVLVREQARKCARAYLAPGVGGESRTGPFSSA